MPLLSPSQSCLATAVHPCPASVHGPCIVPSQRSPAAVVHLWPSAVVCRCPPSPDYYTALAPVSSPLNSTGCLRRLMRQPERRLGRRGRQAHKEEGLVRAQAQAQAQARVSAWTQTLHLERQISQNDTRNTVRKLTYLADYHIISTTTI